MAKSGCGNNLKWWQYDEKVFLEGVVVATDTQLVIQELNMWHTIFNYSHGTHTNQILSDAWYTFCVHQVFLRVLLDHSCTEALTMLLWIIFSEAELFVIGTYHLRQIWVDTKETANFFETIFKVRGEECGHILGRTIKPNTSEVLDKVYSMNDAILIFNYFHKDLTCFSCRVTSVGGDCPAIP